MNILQLRKLSDAELVEQTRRQLQRDKRWIWFWVIVVGAGSILFFWQSISSINDLATWMIKLPQNPHDPSSGRAERFWENGVKVGASLGFGLGTSMSTATAFFFYLLSRLLVDRRDKLLVAYYDQLHSSNE